MSAKAEASDEKPPSRFADSKADPIMHANVRMLEHGRGPAVEGVEVPYCLEIMLDGEEAFHCYASDFKFVGQFERFIEWIQRRISTEPKPAHPSRSPYTGWLLKKRKADPKFIDRKVANLRAEIAEWEALRK